MALILDARRHLSATAFQINRPVLRNIGVWRGGTNWLCITTPSSLKAYLDPSKPPLA